MFNEKEHILELISFDPFYCIRKLLISLDMPNLSNVNNMRDVFLGTMYPVVYQATLRECFLTISLSLKIWSTKILHTKN